MNRREKRVLTDIELSMVLSEAECWGGHWGFGYVLPCSIAAVALGKGKITCVLGVQNDDYCHPASTPEFLIEQLEKHVRVK